MKKALVEYCQHLYDLHVLIADDKSDSEDADNIRDEMDLTWVRLDSSLREIASYISSAISLANSPIMVFSHRNVRVLRGLIENFQLSPEFQTESPLILNHSWRLVEVVAEIFQKIRMEEARADLLSKAVSKAGNGFFFSRWLLTDIVANRRLSSHIIAATAGKLKSRVSDAILGETAYKFWLPINSEGFDTSPLPDLSSVIPLLRKRRDPTVTSLANHLEVAIFLSRGEKSKARDAAKSKFSEGLGSRFLDSVQSGRSFNATVRGQLASAIRDHAKRLVAAPAAIYKQRM